MTILSWYCTLTTTCCDQHGQHCLHVSPVCRFLPGPPEDAVDWSLLFGDAGLERRAQLKGTSLGQPCIRGWLMVLEVVQQSSVGLCLHLIFRQEVDHLLDTPGVTLIGSWWTRNRVSMAIELLLSHKFNRHLQDVCFLHLGVRLLFDELWTQQRLELLNAAVDSLSA